MTLATDKPDASPTHPASPPERANTTGDATLRESPTPADAQWDKVTPAVQRELTQASADGRFPVLLCGAAGRGKTCAMAALFRRTPGTVQWLNAVEFVRWIQTARRDGEFYFPNSAYGCSEAHLWRTRVDQPGWLFVDDLGIRNPSDSVYEIVYELVNRRGTRPTVYSSNLTPKELASVFDARIASRLSAGTILEFNGVDRRLEHKRYVQVQ